MNIGIVCNEYPPSKHGGIGSFTKDLAEGLVQKGHNVYVVGIYSEKILPLNELSIENINGVKVFRYPIKKFKNKYISILYNRLFFKNELEKIIKKYNLELIESPELHGWLWQGVKNAPLVTRLHAGETYLGKELMRPYSRLYAFFEKQQLKQSEQIIAVSKYVADKTLNIFKLNKSYEVIYNAVKIEFHENSNVKDNEKYIIFFGTLNEKKGVKELVKAMNIVFERYPDIKLYICGKDTYIQEQKYSDYILTFVRDKYKKNIIYKGVLQRDKELFPLIKNSLLCCLPSKAEAFSLAPLESMLLGVPTIFTNTTSGKEVIEHLETGLLCDPYDYKNIANQILLLLDNPEISKKIALEGQKYVQENFSYEKWLDKNIELYRRIINEI